MQAIRLNLIVFLSGAGIMILELSGSRIIAPFLGSSIYIWTSLIGVILASLSLGYWWGGKLADAHPSFEYFSRLLLAASVATMLIAPLQYPILFKLGSAGFDLRLSALIGAGVLFAVPSALMGCVTPFALRLALRQDLTRSGTVAGSLYALSTLGSITGTFLTGFLLLVWLGSMQLVLVVSALLLLSSMIASPRDKVVAKLLFLILLICICVLSRTFVNTLEQSGLWDIETQYQRVMVVDTHDASRSRDIRVLMTDPLGSQSVMFVDNPLELAAEYSRLYDLAFAVEPSLHHALMIGGGAYSYPKYFLANHPSATMDVVEIDPGITAIARTHFHLEDSPRLRIFHEDARTFINRQQERYDAIFLDAFGSSPSVPFQLTTIEAVRRMHAALQERGVLLVNLISAVDGPNGQFLRAELATYQAVFPKVYVFAAQQLDDGSEPQNFILLALKSNASELPNSHGSTYEALLARRWLAPVANDLPILTDQRAPVERYTLPVLQRLALQIPGKRNGNSFTR